MQRIVSWIQHYPDEGESRCPAGNKSHTFFSVFFLHLDPLSCFAQRWVLHASPVLPGKYYLPSFATCLSLLSKHLRLSFFVSFSHTPSLSLSLSHTHKDIHIHIHIHPICCSLFSPAPPLPRSLIRALLQCLSETEDSESLDWSSRQAGPLYVSIFVVIFASVFTAGYFIAGWKTHACVGFGTIMFLTLGITWQKWMNAKRYGSLQLNMRIYNSFFVAIIFVAPVLIQLLEVPPSFPFPSSLSRPPMSSAFTSGYSLLLQILEVLVPKQRPCSSV